MDILEELTKEVIERVKYSKKHNKEVMKRVDCSKGRSNSNNKYIS